MDMIGGDIKKLSEDLEAIREPVTKAAESAEAKGDRRFRLEDLKEQKTLLRKNGTVLQFNRVDHLTGRTPMERFFLRASNEINGLIALSNDVKNKYESLLEFFGEDCEMPSNEFFGTMNKFIKEFMVSEIQVEKEEMTRQKDKRRSEVKAKAAAVKSKAAGKTHEPIMDENDTKPEVIPAKHPLEEIGLHPFVGLLGAQADDATDGKPTPADGKVEPPSPMPLVATPASQQQTPDATVSKAIESSSVHPLAAMLAARSESHPTTEADEATKKSSNENGLVTENNEEKEGASSSAHPLAAMLAARNQSLEDSEGHIDPSSAAHPLKVVLAATQETDDVAENTEEHSEPSSTADLPAAELTPQQEDAQTKSTEESSSPKVEQASAAHPQAAMLAAHDNGSQDPPVPNDDDASLNTVDEAAALIEEESGKIVNGKASPSTLRDNSGIVQADSTCDPPAPHVSEDTSTEYAAKKEEVTQNNKPDGNSWLTEVMKATRRQDQMSRPFLRQESADTDSTNGYTQGPSRQEHSRTGDSDEGRHGAPELKSPLNGVVGDKEQQ